LRIITISTAAVVVATIALLSFHARQSPPLEGILGTADDRHEPDFWIARIADPDETVFGRPAIDAQNRKLFEVDRSMHDLAALPDAITRQMVLTWIEDLAERPEDPLYDESGAVVPQEFLDDILDERNLGAVPERQTRQYGLVVQRAALRTFPTDRRVFRSADNTDIDRFQEDALFPGTPVLVAHESGDGNWWFVVSPRYAAWVRKQYVALGDAEEVFAYQAKEPYRIVTGATVRTVFTPERPELSELQLDMGIRVPEIADWPLQETVNGQNASGGIVVELPMRSDNGRLATVPALLQKNADTERDYLPLTRGNIVRQAFKFLGERYGWGHSYNGRDCSGFVSEVYRSMGVMLPRNTSSQSVSPALQVTRFGESDAGGERLAAVRSLEVGDLVYIPGHVMMVIGFDGDEPWVIHDTTGAAYLDADEQLVRVNLNAVAVTPLLPLRTSETESYVDRMTSIVRVVPAPAT
jgi:cell wall-associated NlpC family hydrolase